MRHNGTLAYFQEPSGARYHNLVYAGYLMSLKVLSFERVTFAEDRLREAQFWATKSIAERVIAGWELADDDLIRRKHEHEPEKRTAVTFRRVKRGTR